MERCVRLACPYRDAHLVELEIFAWNGKFGGLTCLYIGHGDLADAAARLTGFPLTLEDRREVAFGEIGSGTGAIGLTFSCHDGAGHCQVQVAIETDFRNLPTERVEMYGVFEPAALDRFVEQPHELNSALTGSAVLALV